MDLEFLEKFCESKGLEIAEVLLKEYDATDFEINSREIEKDIYEVATSHSRILFFESKGFLLEPVRNEVRSLLSVRFDHKQIQKLRDLELVAHWIKLEVIRTLEDKDISLD